MSAEVVHLADRRASLSEAPRPVRSLIYKAKSALLIARAAREMLAERGNFDRRRGANRTLDVFLGVVEDELQRGIAAELARMNLPDEMLARLKETLNLPRLGRPRSRPDRDTRPQ